MSVFIPDWLTDSSPYPGNDIAFRELREALRRARTNPQEPRTICFAGAGCSMPLLPGWGELLSGMRDYLTPRVRLSAQRSALNALPAPKEAAGGYLGFADALRANVDPASFSRALKDRLTLPKGRVRFCRTHAAIVCMNVDGIVTTNFDLCLSDAQARRFQLDPTWFDCQQGLPCEVGLNSGAHERIEAWLKDGRAFSFGGETRSPLYLHGCLLSPGGAVISASDYSRFYGTSAADNAGAFFLENLVGVASLIFVGYSFSDPFIDTVLARVAKRPFWRGDHFALLGVRDSELGDLDTKTKKLAELRITPIYYPIAAPDHPALQTLMDALECYDSAMVDRIAVGPNPLPPDHITAASLLCADAGFGPVSAIHDSAQEWNKLPQVNLNQYVERAVEFHQLDELASNVRVRIICLLGLGGSGKTTLLRRVFDEKSLAAARFPDGVLVHPIRDDAQADAIVDALCERHPPLIPLDRDDRASRLHHAVQILRRKRMLLVLDGAELLQERPGQAAHGRFLSDDLRALLLATAREGQALVVITSRFAPIEFNAHLGASYRTVDLRGFTPPESLAFLHRVGVSGDDSVLASVHYAFDGHPLGIALFAGAVTSPSSALAAGDIRAALELLRSATSLNERLGALLNWYQGGLSSLQLAMLTLLAVYPTSVSQAEVYALLQAGRVKAGDRVLTAQEGREALSSLEQLRLIQFDTNQGRYECHAVVRQGMRRRDPGAARAAITSLTGDAPTFMPVETIDELQRVVDAVEIAVESLGDFGQASRLIVVQLKSGKRFFDLGVPNIGVVCLGRLVSGDPWSGGQTRRQAAEVAIGETSVGAYVAWMREFHEWLGNLSEAERWRRLDGERYIDWAAESDDRHYKFWTDGLNYARARGDATARQALRTETWRRYGAAIRRAFDDSSEDMDDVPLLRFALSFADVSHWRDDPWFQLNLDLYRHALQFPTGDLVLIALDLVVTTLGGFAPAPLIAPEGRYREDLITTKLEDIRARQNRLHLSLHRIRFIELARKPGLPAASEIFNLLSHFARRDCKESDVILARALLAIGESLERSYAVPQAARARSWAAQRLISAGHAVQALDWSNRALDVCGEDQQERARALYMRAMARLALGQFTDAIADACLTATLAKAANERYQLSEVLELRWRAAKEAGDPRASEWGKEARTLCKAVYRQNDYDELPDFALLPGETGFQKEHPNIDWPDDLLSAAPTQMEVLLAVGNGTFGDLLQRFRADVLAG